MTRLKLFFFSLILTVFSTQCSSLPGSPARSAPINIQKVRPVRIGMGLSGSHGFNDYMVYRYSVEIKAATGVATITEAYVFDADRDGQLDSVLVLDRGIWYFDTVLGPEYRLIKKTASPGILRDYLTLGNHARKAVKARSKIIPKPKTITAPSPSQSDSDFFNKEYVPQ